MTPSIPAAAALALAWFITAGAAMLASLVTPWAAVVPGALAAIVAITSFTIPPRAQVFAAVVVATAPAVTLAPEIGWIVGGVVAALAITTRTRHAERSLADLQRHLAWCRRRDEPAHVVVIRVPAEASMTPAQLRSVFRLTDSVHVEEDLRGFHVTAIVDGTDFSREGLEHRFRSAVTAGVEFGWSEFPADGFTLSVLIDAAARDQRGVALMPAARIASGRERRSPLPSGESAR